MLYIVLYFVKHFMTQSFNSQIANGAPFSFEIGAPFNLNEELFFGSFEFFF